MVKIVFLFFKRNPKLFLKVGSLSFFLFLLISFYAVGYASFEKISVNTKIGDIENDLEIQGQITDSYTIDNISLIYSYNIKWIDSLKDWKQYVISDGLVLIIKTSFNEDSFIIGLDLSSNSKNTKRRDLTNETIEFFNNQLDISNFTKQDSLPFNLDILINYNQLNNSHFSELNIDSNNCNMGYFVDISTKLISSFKMYTKILNKIESNFIVFVSQNDIISLNRLESYKIEIEIDLFKESFQSLILLITFISILISTWLIEFFSSFYYYQIKEALDKFQKRGLNDKKQNKITKFLPIATDTISFIILEILYLLISIVFHINLIYAYISVVMGYFYLLYKRIKLSNLNDENSIKMGIVSFVKYVIILLIFSIILILTNNTLYALIPPLVSSFFSTGSIIIQYYVITILLSEFSLKLKKKVNINKLTNNMFKLIEKSIISGKQNLKSWIHITILVIWSMSIIFTSINTFTANYNLNQTIEYPTDIIIEVEGVYLANISKIEILPEVENILPISHSVEQYFFNYDYYLMDFSKVKIMFPEFVKLSKLNDIQEEYTYIHKTMAEELNLNNNDLFPTKFGKNQTNIIVNQPIFVTKYFPLIKTIEERPFVVSNYRAEYENLTMITKIMINFNNSFDEEQSLEKIKNILKTNFQIQKKNVSLDYNVPLNICKYFFFVISLFICSLSFIQLISQLSPIFRKMNLRGLKKRHIYTLLLRQFSSYIITAIIIGVISALFFIFVQMQKTIYHITLFTPIKIYFDFCLLMLILVPLSYFVILYIFNMLRKD